MKKSILYICAFIAAAVLFCSFSLFETPPGAAAVTDNISIVSIDPDFIDEIGNAATAFEDLSVSINDLMDKLIILAILLTVLVLSFIKNDVFLKTAAGLLLVFAGLSWIEDLPESSLVLIVFGAFKFFNAIYLIFASGRAARGLSQFKQWYNRVKGG